MKKGKNALEWTVFALSAVLITALLSYLSFEALTHRDSPPLLQAQLKKSVRAGQKWMVEVEVSNRGGRSARGVEIEVEWAAQKQSAHFVLPDVPREGKRNGWVVFDDSARTSLAVSALKARVVGFESD